MKLDDDHKCPEGLAPWMATFADLMSLLLCFFVLIVSFSSMQQVEFQKAMGSLRGALGILNSKRSIIHLQANPTTPIKFRKLSMIWEKTEELRELIKIQGIESKVKVQAMDNAIKFTLDDEILFDSGQSRLKPSSLPYLRKIAEMNMEGTGILHIAGHTDNIPIRSNRFPSNWELSSSRAINVLHYFENLGIPRTSLSCSGYADTRPEYPNTTAENRQKNRRVEIVLELGDLSNPYATPVGQKNASQRPNFIVPAPEGNQQ